MRKLSNSIASAPKCLSRRKHTSTPTQSAEIEIRFEQFALEKMHFLSPLIIQSDVWFVATEVLRMNDGIHLKLIK